VGDGRAQRLPGEIDERDDQQDNNRAIQLAARLRRDRLLPVYVLLELQAVGRQLERPREKQGQREAENEEECQCRVDPLGEMQCRRQGFADLQ